jgi:DNA modification methylase
VGSAWDLRLGDCLDPVTGLASLPDKSVDVVITDPPYAPRAMKNARSATMLQRRDGKVYDFGYAALTPEVRIEAALQFARLARRWVIVWCDIESPPEWRSELEGYGLRYIRTGIWVRVNSAPQFSGDRPANGVEACVIAHPEGRMRWNGGGAGAVWTGPIVNSQAHMDRGHSSPKPEWLMGALVSDFTDPGELVLDPFAGSGTTGVSAIRLGRRFLGWERDPKYHAAAVRRLQGTKEQTDMFRPRAPKAKQGTLGLAPSKPATIEPPTPEGPPGGEG